MQSTLKGRSTEVVQGESQVAISDLMAQSGVAFGTSGARGLVVAMTDAVCFAYTAAFLQHMAAVGEFAPGTPVALAGDLRASTPRILAACMAAITFWSLAAFVAALFVYPLWRARPREDEAASP